MTRWTERKIIEYNMNRNCECGNHCYRVVGGTPGNFLIEWKERHPDDCPFMCQDCEAEVDDNR